MREFTCIVCGAKGIDGTTRGNRVFCSKKCCNKYQTLKLIPCKFNEGVNCEKQECSNCGWTPDVAQRRKEALYERQSEIEMRYT